MKKLLGILGTITIAGSGMSEIGANVSSKIDENNNLQILSRDRVKRQSFEKWYRFLSSDSLKARLSFQDVQLINYHYEIEDKDTFIKSTIKILKKLPADDHSGAGGSITNEDYQMVAETIWEKYSLFHEIFLKFSKENKQGYITVVRLHSGGYYSDECTIFETGTGCDL